MTATECDAAPPFNISDVYLFYEDEYGVWHSGGRLSQYAPGPPRQWRGVLSNLGFKPTDFKLTWDTYSYSQQTRGVKHIDVDYCCQ